MRILSLIFVFSLMLVSGFSQDFPHGDDFEIDCELCHNPESWGFDKANFAFDHNTAKFALVGQHTQIDCRLCHKSLVFSQAIPECASCHQDMHYQTVGLDCARCHTPKSWLVENVTDIHQMGRFPLVGAHYAADCSQCHPSASLLRFEPLGIECIDCHQEDYQATTNPNHVQSNFSTNCIDCHSIDAFSWSSSGFNHDFFPLTQGHSISDCSQCHPGNDFSTASPECISCHQSDYNSTSNPNHAVANIPTDCILCHTTEPGWKPAEFRQHDAQYFPIYSGQHNGEWSTCADCHTNPGNYSLFSCIDCHEHNQSDMNDKHQGIGGYSWNSIACLECHPTGDEEGSFNHNATNFELTGAHLSMPTCFDCHKGNYTNTPNDCASCHTPEYQQTSNPNHNAIGISNVCETCHTTMPDWIPAGMPTHNDYYVLEGAHVSLANDCALCHDGNYNNSPDDCYGCHSTDYNQTIDPPHQSAQFPVDCEVCHTQTVWEPSSFDHDGQYFPIYSGRHSGEWDQCSDCHDNTGNYASFTCLTCHLSGQTNDDHSEVADYAYNSIACLQCHPNGTND